MTVYEPWNAERGTEIIAEYTHLEGATLVILHALQETFATCLASALNLSRAEVHGVFTFIYIANQIGKFFQSQGRDKAVHGIAEHIRKFWDPRMRSAILAHLDAGGAGLDPNVHDAIAALKPANTELQR
jgi:formate dehydrogenase subunit delta